VRKRFLRLPNIQKWTLRERETDRFVFSEEIFQLSKSRKNGHFTNGMTPGSLEERIIFLGLGNIQKISIRERETAHFVFRKEIFSGA
jgi:hypothetical protein